MTKKILIDENGLVVSIEDESIAPTELRRCRACNEPLDPGKPHECKLTTVGKTVFKENKRTLPPQDDAPPIQPQKRAIISLVCPVCRRASEIQSLGDHVRLHPHDSYWIMYLLKARCPFCGDHLSVSELTTHLNNCSHRPMSGSVMFRFKTTFENQVNILVETKQARKPLKR